jgi:hypothetical protein
VVAEEKQQNRVGTWRYGEDCSEKLIYCLRPVLFTIERIFIEPGVAGVGAFFQTCPVTARSSSGASARELHTFAEDEATGSCECKSFSVSESNEKLCRFTTSINAQDMQKDVFVM